MQKKFSGIASKKHTKCCFLAVLFMLLLLCATMTVFAGGTGTAASTSDIWAKGKELIINLYNQIVGISTVLAGLMSAIAVIGAKLSNNQHKVDQSWDWLRRIWVAWAIINGIGAFIAYITPLFDGMNTLS